MTQELEKKRKMLQLWIPGEVADIWAQGGNAVEEHCGDYQCLLLDVLRSVINDQLIVEVEFAEAYKSYEGYRVYLEETATALSKSEIDDRVKWVRERRGWNAAGNC